VFIDLPVVRIVLLVRARLFVLQEPSLFADKTQATERGPTTVHRLLGSLASPLSGAVG
jgi:hypothetical protein